MCLFDFLARNPILGTQRHFSSSEYFSIKASCLEPFLFIFGFFRRKPILGTQRYFLEFVVDAAAAVVVVVVDVVVVAAVTVSVAVAITV